MNEITSTSHPVKHSSSQSRFLVMMAVVLLIFAALAAYFIYHREMKNLEANAYEKTDLIMKAIEANREYVQEVLRPVMYTKIGEKQFILEAMSSSYISRMVMERFNKTVRDFVYRRVAINARNPEYEANALEARMIEQFRNDPQQSDWQGIIEQESGQFFMRFQPVFIKDSCLNCHGDPQDAPQEILHLYGSEGGFHHQLHDISGLISVGMPIDANLEKIESFAISLFAWAVPSILFTYVIITLFFNRFIALNLRQVLRIFHTNIHEEDKKSIFALDDDMDEIDELTNSAHAIADHLHTKQVTLERYANELQHSKDLLQSVFDGIADPVALLGTDQRIRMVNMAFLHRFQLSMEEASGQTPAGLPITSRCPLQSCADILAAIPKEPVSFEIHIPSGEIYLIYFYPILREANVEGLICYMKDITVQKKLEAKIQHTEKIASIGQLAAGFAHEINNPLGVILCHIDLLNSENNLSSAAHADLETIRKHTENCRNIVSDLLKFAHQHVSVKQSGSLNAILEDVVLMLSSQFRKQHISLETSLSSDIPELFLDADKMKQVLVNMLLNSAQAIGDTGTVRLASSCHRNLGQVRITITDSGPGISPHIIDKIFDPFFTTKNPGQGTGLGLSVSYGIIKEHDGEITVESRPGQPTCFSIILPLPKDKT